MRWKTLHDGLLSRLEWLGPEVDRRVFLECVRDWLHACLRGFSPELRKAYGLDEYAVMDLTRYPIDDASFTPSEEVQQLRAVPPSSMDVLAMRVRDLFWQAITVESSVTCPRCSGSGLRILEDSLTGEMVLECDTCAWAQTPSGEPYRTERGARVPGKEFIARARSTLSSAILGRQPSSG
jgi:hypothetical protein